MKNIKHYIIAFAAIIAVLGVAPATLVGASPASEINQGIKDVGGDDEANQVTLGARIKTVINVMLYILGAIAVVMIVIGGIRYTTSNGESSQVKSAKDTIMYSIIGLVVAILSYAIVNFVLSSFFIS